MEITSVCSKLLRRSLNTLRLGRIHDNFTVQLLILMVGFISKGLFSPVYSSLLGLIFFYIVVLTMRSIGRTIQYVKSDEHNRQTECIVVQPYNHNLWANYLKNRTIWYYTGPIDRIVAVSFSHIFYYINY